VNASSEQCPSCGANLAPDQRYCLECGQRRGDPRLPFMDAVVFMDAVKQPTEVAAAAPPPPREAKQGITANAAMIAGIGTLVLAIGVGVLIGRSGDNGAATAAATPQIIKVGGGTETASASSENEASSAGKKKKGGSAKSKASANTAAADQAGQEAAEEVLKPAGDVKLPPPTAKVGADCEKGTAGCGSGGEFDGSFFGE
jgi:hypothetical protein